MFGVVNVQRLCVYEPVGGMCLATLWLLQQRTRWHSSALGCFNLSLTISLDHTSTNVIEVLPTGLSDICMNRTEGCSNCACLGFQQLNLDLRSLLNAASDASAPVWAIPLTTKSTFSTVWPVQLPFIGQSQTGLNRPLSKIKSVMIRRSVVSSGCCGQTCTVT